MRCDILICCRFLGAKMHRSNGSLHGAHDGRIGHWRRACGIRGSRSRSSAWAPTTSAGGSISTARVQSSMRRSPRA